MGGNGNASSTRDKTVTIRYAVTISNDFSEDRSSRGKATGDVSSFSVSKATCDRPREHQVKKKREDMKIYHVSKFETNRRKLSSECSSDAESCSAKVSLTGASEKKMWNEEGKVMCKKKDDEVKKEECLRREN